MTLTDGTYKVADGTNLKYDGAANITIAGVSKTPYGLSVLIEGNPGTKAQKEREIIYMTEKSTGSLTLEYITVRNNFAFTGTSDVQAEVVATAGTGNLAAYNCSFLSGQDTLRTTGKAWFYECYIEGDVDFLWMESTGIVALYEKCIIRAIDDRVNNAYFTAPRAGVTSKTGKGLVIYNSTLESEAADTYLGRNPWASSNFEDYYNNVAIVDSPLYLEADATLNSKIWKGASHGTNDQQYVGFKTDDFYASSSAGIGAILSSTVEKAEYAGRENILNRLYNIPGSKFVKDSENFWDLESLISTRNWTVTEDTSKSLLDGEVETVSKVYDFTSATANGYTEADLDGFALESGKTHAKGVAGNTITIPVTRKGIVYVYGYYSGNGTIEVNNQGVGIYDFNNNSTNTFVEKPYVNYSGAGNVIIKAENASYITKVVVEYDDTLSYTPVTGIEITSSSDSYTVGIPVVLSAEVSPATATNTDVVWSSSDESVGTINKYTGEVKFLTQGTVKFTVQACDGSNIAKEITCEPSEATWTSAEWYDTKNSSSSTTSGSGTGLGGSAGENNSIFTLGTTSGVTLGEEKEVTLIDGTTKKISTGIKMNSIGTVAFAVAKNAKVKVLAGYCSDSNATTDYIKITATGDGAVATPYPTNPNGVQTQDVEYEWTLTPGLYTISRGGTGYAPAIYYVRVDIGDFKIEIPATDLTVAPTTANVVIGSTTQLTATVTPSNSTDNVEWTSSDTSVATVDNTGLVTGVKAGTATITAKAGEKEAKCTVTVTTGAVAATGITLDKTTASVTKGETLTLTATVTPSDSTDKVEWSSSDTSVATVDNGVVTALTVGETTITAKAGDKEATCVVTVEPPVPDAETSYAYNFADKSTVLEDAIAGSSTDTFLAWDANWKYHDNTYGAKATANDAKMYLQVAGNVVIGYSGYEGAKGSITVTDADGNAIQSGITAKTEKSGFNYFIYKGEATTLTINVDKTDCYIAKVTVRPWAGEVPAVTAIDIAGNTEVFLADGTASFTAAVTTEYFADSSVIWSVEDGTGSATIDQEGVLTLVSEGTVTVKATSVATPAVSGELEVTISAEAAPFEIGATYTYDFLGDDTAYYQANLSGSKEFLAWVCSGWNGGGHAYNNKVNDSFTVSVVGSVTVSISNTYGGNHYTVSTTGTGTLSATSVDSSVVGADTITYTASSADEACTITFTSNDQNYCSGVSIVSIPLAGATYTYDFLGDDTAYYQANLSGSKEFLAWVCSGWNGGGHAYNNKVNDSFTVSVVGSVTVSISNTYGGNHYTVSTTGTGTLSATSVDSSVVGADTITYTATSADEACTITFTSNDQNYCSGVSFGPVSE